MAKLTGSRERRLWRCHDLSADLGFAWDQSQYIAPRFLFSMSTSPVGALA